MNKRTRSEDLLIRFTQSKPEVIPFWLSRQRITSTTHPCTTHLLSSPPSPFFLGIDPGRCCPGGSSSCGSGCVTLSSPCLSHSWVYDGRPWVINRTQQSMSKNMELGGGGFYYFFCTCRYFRSSAGPLLRHFSQSVWCGNRCLVKPV